MQRETTPPDGDRRKFVDYETAAAMLPDGDAVHVISNPGPMTLIGADWSREEVLQLLREESVQLAGEIATEFGHGLAVLACGRRLFIATKRADA